MPPLSRSLFALTGVVTFGLGAHLAAPQAPSGCTLDNIAGTWTVVTRDSAQDMLFGGTIELTATGGQTHLVSVTEEGTQEDLDFPVDSLAVRRGLLHFRFAPAGIAVSGRCAAADTIAARITVDNSPSPALRIRVTMIRVRGKARP